MIFAERIDGQFHFESAAVALVLSEAELSRPWREVAAERAPGVEYFLESSIVLEMLTDWRATQPKARTELPSFIDRVIHYVEHDA